MRESAAHPLETRPRAPAASLFDACTGAGLDEGGRRCPECPLLHLCISDARWLVRRLAGLH